MPTLVAANDKHVGEAGLRAAATASAAWDPYDIWRTRVLPYQSALRAAAETANNRSADGE